MKLTLVVKCSNSNLLTVFRKNDTFMRSKDKEIKRIGFYICQKVFTHKSKGKEKIK